MDRLLHTFVAVVAIAIVPMAPAGPPQDRAATAGSEKSVLLLPPCLVFEKLQDESPLDPAKFGSTDLGQQLTVAGKRYLRSKGFEINVAATTLPDVATLVEKLQPMSGRLARGSLTLELRTMLAEIAKRVGPSLILAQYLRVRVGAKGYYGPSLSGAMWPGQSETLLAVALIDPAKGMVVWKSEFLVRKVLKSDSEELAKALSTLYGASQ